MLNIFLVYQFLKRLVQPFTSWKAYKLGVIDANGNFLIDKKDRNQEQRDSIGYFDVVVANLKKLLARTPGGASRIATFAAALMLLREDITDESTEDEIMANLKNSLDDICTDAEIKDMFESILWEALDEDGVAANNIGSGAIAHAEVPKKAWRHEFAGQTIFRVDTKRFNEARMGKNRYHRWDKYVGEDEVGQDIREYAKENPDANIIVQDERSSAMMYLRKKR
jgi:hypothetical protein